MKEIEIQLSMKQAISLTLLEIKIGNYKWYEFFKRLKFNRQKSKALFG